MSRSQYDYDCEGLNLYRANVDRAIAGKRGQALLREMVQALDDLPVQVLTANAFEDCGEVCSLGAVALHRDLEHVLHEESEPAEVGEVFGVAECLAAEVMFMNDEGSLHTETAAERWTRMRRWASSNEVTP